MERTALLLTPTSAAEKTAVWAKRAARNQTMGATAVAVAASAVTNTTADGTSSDTRSVSPPVPMAA